VRTIEKILDLARWAPSGDNTQPWRFEIVSDNHVVVHGFDTRDHCVYDLDGHPSQLAVGALLETLVIAASAEGMSARISRRPHTPETHLLFDVELSRIDSAIPDPLATFVETRSVQRRPFSTRRLSAEHKQALESSVAPGFRVAWFESLPVRLRMAKLMFDNARIRLIMPEAYMTHKTIIDWGNRYSDDRVPDQALGLDPFTLKLMRWVMRSWERVEFFNTWLAGTWAPRIQLDLIPGVACGAHCALVANEPVGEIDARIAAGRAVQRFWLTVASLGLGLQPEMTPLIFSRYVREGVRFSALAGATEAARKLSDRLDVLLAGKVDRTVFLARVGYASMPRARSRRLPLARLTWPDGR
jgi:nitroreductase